MSRIKDMLEQLFSGQERIREASDKDLDAWLEAGLIFGYPGAMISGSKTASAGEVVVWNANVCTREHGKIWYGDLNLTRGGYEKAQVLAERLGVAVYVLREMDARFEHERSPRFENAVYSTEEQNDG